MLKELIFGLVLVFLLLCECSIFVEGETESECKRMAKNALKVVAMQLYAVFRAGFFLSLFFRTFVTRQR